MFRLAMRRLRSEWRLMSSVFIGIVIATVLMSAAPAYLDALERQSVNSAVRTAVERAGRYLLRHSGGLRFHSAGVGRDRERPGDPDPDRNRQYGADIRRYPQLSQDTVLLDDAAGQGVGDAGRAGRAAGGGRRASPAVRDRFRALPGGTGREGDVPGRRAGQRRGSQRPPGAAGGSRAERAGRRMPSAD